MNTDRHPILNEKEPADYIKEGDTESRALETGPAASHDPPLYGARSKLGPVLHDLFWFVVVPVAFVFAPVIAWAIRELMPVTDFNTAGVGPAAASLASQLHSGLLLFAVSGWLSMLAVWFFRTPDPDRNFIDYCRAGMGFAFLLYLQPLIPMLVSLITQLLTKGSV